MLLVMQYWTVLGRSLLRSFLSCSARRSSCGAMALAQDVESFRQSNPLAVSPWNPWIESERAFNSSMRAEVANRNGAVENRTVQNMIAWSGSYTSINMLVWRRLDME
jgi:hypothetical protein